MLYNVKLVWNRKGRDSDKTLNIYLNLDTIFHHVLVQYIKRDWTKYYYKFYNTNIMSKVKCIMPFLEELFILGFQKINILLEI